MAEETKTAAPEASVAAPETGSVKETVKEAVVTKAENKEVKSPAETKAPETKTTVEMKETKTEVKDEGKAAEELKSLLDEAGEEGKEGEEKAEVKSPEKYEFKLPEGMVMDEAMLAQAEPLFKELNLTNDQAQKLVELQANYVKATEEQHVKDFEAYVEGLKEETKKFFGTKLKEEMVFVAKARDQFIHKELQDKLNISGLSNDKDVIVMLSKLGRVISEGKFIEGKASGFPNVESGATPATMYDKMKK